MQVADQAHAVSFSRFLDSDEEDCVYDISNTAVRSSTCTHCRSQIYESTSAQSWQVSLITFFSDTCYVEREGNACHSMQQMQPEVHQWAS